MVAHGGLSNSANRGKAAVRCCDRDYSDGRGRYEDRGQIVIYVVEG